MGAWGASHFDNDDAADWVWELENAGSLAPAEAAISEAVSADYLEAPDAAVALAACEALAAANGRPAPDLPDSVTALVAGLNEPPSPELLANARSAAERVLAGSELRELWEETEEFADWQSSVRELIDRLS